MQTWRFLLSSSSSDADELEDQSANVSDHANLYVTEKQMMTLIVYIDLGPFCLFYIKIMSQCVAMTDLEHIM